MKQSILFGNGINRIGSDDFDWKNLLVEISHESVEDIIVPNQLTHSYEKLLLNNKNTSLQTEEKKLKEAFVDKIKSLTISGEAEDIYQRLVNLGASNYMTTNYDGKIEEFLSKKHYKKNCSRESSDYLSLHRREIWTRKNPSKKCVLWPIHGCGYEQKKWNTVMLGFEQYCNSIAYLGHYLNYGFTRTNGYYGSKYGEYLNQASKLSYIQYLIKNNHNKDCSFWADLFFLTDVHIIGFGMDFAEIDIWWVLARRARLMRTKSKDFDGEKLICNKIYYYDVKGNDNDNHKDKDNHKEELLKSYGVECIIKDRPEDKQSWKELYEQFIDKIASTMERRKQY